MNIFNFIEKAKKMHGEYYNYSKVIYVNNTTKVCIICPIHGEFWQTPKNHLKGCGCKLCGINTVKNKKLLTKDIFIEKAKEVHGNKYDYSKVEYTNSKSKVCIICPIHGEFYITPNNHLNGYGCSLCKKQNKNNEKNTIIFIKRAKKVHGDKYNYSKVEYINSSTKVCIICPIHGEFWQTPTNHLQNHGCNKCAIEYRSEITKLSTEQFIEKARKVHDDKYDYSKTEYIDSDTKVCIICPIHGEFWQMPHSHLNKCGCPICNSTYKLSTEQFIKKARKVHGDKYDYSKTEYVNNRTKICIICPIHGEFWQTPTNHLQNHGCFLCKESLLEKKCRKLLIDNNINYIEQHIPSFLKKGKSHLSLDFYLPDYNIAIECQGRQHFLEIDFFGGEKGLKETIKRDKIKKELCEKNNIKLLYFSKLDINFPYKVFTNENELVNKIFETLDVKNEIINNVIVDEKNK